MIRYKTTLDKTLLSSSFTIPAFTIIKPIRIIMKSSTICSIRSILICTKIISCCKNFVYSGYNSLTLIISCVNTYPIGFIYATALALIRSIAILIPIVSLPLRNFTTNSPYDGIWGIPYIPRTVHICRFVFA